MTALPGKWAATISVLAGAGSLIVLGELTNRREAWDTEGYFYWLLPSLWLLCGGLGFVSPVRPWRWGVLVFVSQAAVSYVKKPGGSQLPLAVVLFVFFAAIGALSGSVGGLICRLAERRRGNSPHGK